MTLIMTIINYTTLVILLLQVLKFSWSVSYPVTKPTEGIEYLRRFGYISDSDTPAIPVPQTIFLRSFPTKDYSKTIQDGLKKFQYFAGLPTTGLLDNKTMKYMNLPRCGNKDTLESSEEISNELIPSTLEQLNKLKMRRQRVKRYIVDSKWEKIFLTYKLINYPKHCTMSKGRIDKEIEFAFSLWENEANIHIVKSTSPETMADIEISFVTGNHNDGIEFNEDDGVGKVVAHAWKPFNKQPLRGDIHFNDDATWTSGPNQQYNGFDFLRTLVHEIGHALGLEHSPHIDTIMYFAIEGYEQNLRLSQDDKEGIQELYGKKPRTNIHNNGVQVEKIVRKPLIVPSGTPSKNVPWSCYILQEEDPNNFVAIKQCYQQFYKQYYLTLP